MVLNVKFETLTYAAGPTDFSVGGASGSQDARSTSLRGRFSAARLSVAMGAFLIRLAAYFQGCLPRLPRMASQERLTVIDTAMAESSGPLQIVTMNRALSRRMRWLIKRGRVERSGKMRLATAADKARCNLTPGQFNEYMIRVDGVSRIRLYHLGLSRHVRRLRSITCAGLQGDALCLGKAAICLAPLMPD